MESIATSISVSDLMDIDEDSNVFLFQHINNLPKELLIEIFRYIRTLKDRHNAMLVCRFWYELLQDPCFMHHCPEILTIKEYHISVNSKFFKTFFSSNRKFNQLRIWRVSWSYEDEQIIGEFFEYFGKEIRIVYCDDSYHWIDFLTLFPQMTELRISVDLDILAQYTEFGPELRSLVVQHLNPKKLDLNLPIFHQIKTLKTKKRLKIFPNSEILNELDDNLERCLSKFCELKYVRIITGSNLLRKEPLSFQDIDKLVLKVPVKILIDNLISFPKLKKISIDCCEDPEDRSYSCQFVHAITKCPSIRKIEFQLLHSTMKKFCKICMEIMLKSFPNLRSLKLRRIEYSDPEELFLSLAKYCPDLKTLQLDHHSIYNQVIATPDRRPVLGLMPNLTKLTIFHLALDLLRDWPELKHLKAISFVFSKYPDEISSWKPFVKNSPNLVKIYIDGDSYINRVYRVQDHIPSHKHIKEIVQGFKNLQELILSFNKLTSESLEPIYTYSRSLKRIQFSMREDPKPKFKLEHVFKLFKRIPCFRSLNLRFDFEDGRNRWMPYLTTRSDYQLPKQHLAECLNQYEDLDASIAYIRANLMSNDKEYNGPIDSLGSKDLSDVNLYLGIDIEEYMTNNPMYTWPPENEDEF